jgi:hypothetical protein
MGLDRQQAVQLLTSYFPVTGTFGQGQIGFDHIAKDYGGSGTTCGFPTHWVLWRLSCDDSALVNRYEPDTGFTYTDGENLSKIAGHSAFVRLDNSKNNREQFLNGSIRPRPGDTIFITGGKKTDAKGKEKYDEHVYMVIGEPTGSAKDKIEWPVTNSGMGEEGKQKGKIISARGVSRKGGEWKDTLDGRTLLGWLDIDKLNAGTNPNVPSWDFLAAHSLEPSSGPPRAENVIGVWKISKPYSDSFYVFYKGHRVFRVASGNLSIFTDKGVWFPQAGKIFIYWESLLADGLTIIGESGVGRDDFSSYTALKTMSTAQVMKSYHNNRGIPLNEKTHQKAK